MEIVWYIIAGLLSGIVAGMGMGGGTLLIPVLTIFFSIEQQMAQGINLLAFLPTAVVALIIHWKNGLVDFKKGLPIIVTGVVASVGGSLLAMNLKNRVLQVLFGVFLLLIGILQLVMMIVGICKKKKDNKKEVKGKIKIVLSKRPIDE